MPFNVGENVGPYRIVEQFGQGGMATVFKAYHASLDRYVALKALHPAFNQDPNFEARFQREARVVAKLEHPNIVPIYDYSEHEKRPYLVMKFIEGVTLKARMDQGPLSSEEITKIVDAVGSGLAYAHKQGVLHRDIKPSNVLIATDGQIYLADFGLARIAQSGESTLSSDMIMGTPQYISPEQAMGKADLDQRTDLYSFGVMLYEMVVGKVPFNADTPFSIIHDHIYSPLPMPRVVNPKVPEPVERVLLKALAKERDDRFEDAARLISAFKQAWNEAGVPMQGSDVRVSQVVDVKAEPTKVAVIPEAASSAKVTGAPGGTVRAEEKPAVAAAGAKSKRKRSPWVWAGAVLVVVCICALVIVRNNRLSGGLPAEAGVQTAAPGQPQPPSQTKDTPLPPDVQPFVTRVGGVVVPPEVAGAEQRANENPNDRDAQFELALAYWNAGWSKEAYEAVGNVIRLSNTGSQDYFVQAGDKFRSQKDGWLPAAAFYFQAVRSYQIGGDVPEPLMTAFREAMYKGASRPEVPSVVPFDKLMLVNRELALIVQARHALFTDRFDEGMKFLEEARTLNPDRPEAALLQGEFHMHARQMDEARMVLEPLIGGRDIPEWIKLFAQQLLDGNK